MIWNKIWVLVINALLAGCQWLGNTHQPANLSKAEVAEQIRPFTNQQGRPTFISNFYREPSLVALSHKGFIIYDQENEYQFIIPTDTFFEANSDELRSENLDGLDRLASLLKKYKHNPIIITGHSDHMGSHKYKEELSKKQAERIKSYFWSKGIEQKRMLTRGLADLHPISSEDAKGSRLNRRVVVSMRIPS